MVRFCTLWLMAMQLTVWILDWRLMVVSLWTAMIIRARVYQQHRKNSLHTVCTLDMDVTQLQYQAMISATSILQHRQWYGRLWQIFLEQVPMILQLISYVHQHLIRPILTLTIQRLRTISVHPIMLQDQVSQAQPRVEQPLMNWSGMRVIRDLKQP